MYKFLLKRGTTIAFAVGGFISIITIIAIFAGLSDFEQVPKEQQPYAKEGNIFLPGLYLTILLLVASVVVTVVMSVLGALKNPKGAVKGLIAFAGIFAVYLVLYLMAYSKCSGSLAFTIEKFQISEGISKMITAGLQISLILTVGSVLIAAVMEGINFFKNSR
ncbi:MAG: hypothetical protein AAB316_02430 [Bacteroidota bacterium]